MRYKVGEIEIRSENAARSMSQPSHALLDWIAPQERVNHGLDYGCGKLRYAGALAEKCNTLTLVDSAVQLDRVQKIGDEKTTVRAYAASIWPHARVLDVEEFASDKRRYELTLCVNVLSAIPLEEVRTGVLLALRDSLAPTGVCLLVAQYQNSYFKKVAASPNAIPHLDGWILKSRSGNSYYGILPKPKLEALVLDHGFGIVRSWIEGQSAYVLACRENSPLIDNTTDD